MLGVEVRWDLWLCAAKVPLNCSCASSGWSFPTTFPNETCRSTTAGMVCLFVKMGHAFASKERRSGHHTWEMCCCVLTTPGGAAQPWEAAKGLAVGQDTLCMDHPCRHGRNIWILEQFETCIWLRFIQ